MDRTRIQVFVLLSILVCGASCRASPEVEKLYFGGWVFLAMIFIALVVLLALIVRYLAAGRKTPPTAPPVDTIPSEDTGDPNDWV